MGVPGFYKWLVQRYPLIRRRLSDIPCPKIDNLYIDFNCIIYNSLQNVTSTEPPYTILFQEVCRFLDVLIQSIRPQCLIFIAVDGPAPFAKCTQQRSRRFVSARDYVPGGFDTTQISVGTEFMELLHDFLTQFLQEKTKTDKIWGTPDVIYSSHRSPGEGEHKFFNFIRSNIQSKNITENTSHCIYSPDADLLFLGLQTRQPYFYILREWDGWIGPNERVGNGKLDKLKFSDVQFELINLMIARECLQLDYPKIPDINRIIDDFAAFSFLIGNDFIPHFPDVVIQSGQFTSVVQTYQNTIMGKEYLINDEGKIDKKVLKELLTNYVLEFHNNDRSGTIKSDGEARKYLMSKYPEEFKMDPDNFERDLANAVLDSFDWVFDYYTKGCQSWNWCFPFPYPPPLITVAKYCEGHRSTFELDRPPLPFEQLLSIEPPQSADHLPPGVRQLMFPPSPIAHFYPKTFEIDLNGRRFEHEGVVLIPMIKIDDIREEFQKVAKDLTPEEVKRNTLMNDLIVKDGQVSDYDESKLLLLKKRAEDDSKPPFWPSLYDANIQFTYSKANCKINLFGMASFSASIFIHFAEKAYDIKPPKKVNELKNILNKPILINWPYLKPALVSAVIDRGGFVLPEEIKVNKKEVENIFSNTEKHYKQTYAIDCSDENVILAVHPVLKTSIEQNRFRFDSNTIFVPYQFTTSVHSSPSFLTYFDRKQPPELTVGMTVVVKSGQNQGRIGKVVSVGNDKNATIEILNAKKFDGFDKLFNDEQEQWESINAISDENQIPIEKVQKLLSSVVVQIGESKTFDVAFTAYSKGKVLDGFCRSYKEKDGDEERTHYEVTKEFVSKVNEYISSPLLSFLLDLLKDDKVKNIGYLNAKKIWPDDDFTSSSMKTAELTQFMKEQLNKKFFLIDDFIDSISQTTLSKIEEKLIHGSDGEIEGQKDVVENIDNLIWAGKPKEIEQKCGIGSRVINLTTSGPIPFGAVGTVVQFDRKNLMFSVVLDDEFKYGNNLRKRLRTNRGYIARIDDLFFIQ